MATSVIESSEAHRYQKCVLTYGHFSTIHPGHIRYLRHARNLGKQLVIALIGDEGETNFPFIQSERAEALCLLGIADAVLLLQDDDLDQAIRTKTTVLVLGNEYKDKEQIQTIVKRQEQQGSVQFHAGDHATTDLLSASERDLRQQRLSQLKAACQRQELISFSY